MCSVGDVLRDARTGCTPVVFGYHGTARHKALLVGLGVWVGFIFCLGLLFFFSGRNARFKEKIKKKEKAVSGIQKSRLGWVLETALEIVVSVVGFF